MKNQDKGQDPNLSEKGYWEQGQGSIQLEDGGATLIVYKIVPFCDLKEYVGTHNFAGFRDMLTLYRKSTDVQRCHDKFHFIKLDVTM